MDTFYCVRSPVLLAGAIKQPTELLCNQTLLGVLLWSGKESTKHDTAHFKLLFTLQAPICEELDLVLLLAQNQSNVPG